MRRKVSIGRWTVKLPAWEAIAILIILITFWLRVQNLNQYPPGLTTDEAQNVIEASQISQVWRFPFYEDPRRPEPIFRTIGTLSALFLGRSVWAQRFTTAMLGTLAVAALFWAARQCLPDLRRDHRWLASLAAAGSLAVSIGHITLTRSTYRGGILPLFILLFAGFLLRGLRLEKRKDFFFAALFLAAAAYTYFPGLIVPLSVAIVAVSLFLFKRPKWRRWLPNLIFMTIVVLLLVSPILFFAATDSERIFAQVGNQLSDPRNNMVGKLKGTWDQFMKIGYEIPLYNTASAPMVPRTFDLLFLFGLLALLLRVRQPSSALVAGLLLLMPIPMIAANTVPQNLRSVGLYAVYPLVIGLGMAQLVKVVRSNRSLVTALFLLPFLMIGADTIYAVQTYNGYWNEPNTRIMFNREIPYGEWFFRTDRRDFAHWLVQQDTPLLVPMNELNGTAVRAWLMQNYPTVESAAGSEINIPPDTRLVIPWNLDINNFAIGDKEFALLNEGVITLLPPFTPQTHQMLLANIENAPLIVREEGELPLLARIKPVPNVEKLSFMAMSQTTDLIYDNNIRLSGWSGPDVIMPGQYAEYTLFLEAQKPLWHRYEFYMELYTQDRERKAWNHDSWNLSWLFPTFLWQPGQTVVQQYGLQIPIDFQPGAYRLVTTASLTYFPGKVQPVSLTNGTQLDNPVTMTWLKVPQTEIPTIPESAARFDVNLADSIALEGAYATVLENGRLQLSLFWKGLKHRPDFDATIFVHILDAEGNVVAQVDERPWGGQYPTFIWDENELVQTVHQFDIGSLPLDSLSVQTGMYLYPNLQRLSVMQNGAPVDDGVVRLGNAAALLTQ